MNPATPRIPLLMALAGEECVGVGDDEVAVETAAFNVSGGAR